LLPTAPVNASQLLLDDDVGILNVPRLPFPDPPPGPPESNPPDPPLAPAISITIFLAPAGIVPELPPNAKFTVTVDSAIRFLERLSN
jgi:hypothetical protein